MVKATQSGQNHLFYFGSLTPSVLYVMEISVGILQYTYPYMTEVYVGMYQRTLVFTDPGINFDRKVKGLMCPYYVNMSVDQN